MILRYQVSLPSSMPTSGKNPKVMLCMSELNSQLTYQLVFSAKSRKSYFSHKNLNFSRKSTLTHFGTMTITVSARCLQREKMLKIGQKLKIRRFMATVNEVEKFARMKSDWWDQSGQNAALHSVMLIFSLISILTKKIFFFESFQALRKF